MNLLPTKMLACYHTFVPIIISRTFWDKTVVSYVTSASNTFSDQVSPCIIIMMLRSISDCFSFVLFFVDTVDFIWGTSLLCFVYIYKKMAQQILHRREIRVLHVIPSRKVLLLQLEPGSTSSWMEKAWSCQSQEHCMIPIDCTLFFEFNVIHNMISLS